MSYLLAVELVKHQAKQMLGNDTVFLSRNREIRNGFGHERGDYKNRG